jgi:hypothetical protein
VEESEKVDLKAATEMADHLAQDVFPQYRVGLLHGRLKPDAKERVMGAFLRGEFHILVSTTVVEVGVDVANAGVMLVEHAERFGLSQLHQLRGRVGRGAHQSYCILLYQYPLTEDGRERLKALTDTTDGFEIAERDLQLRGPGDFFGTRQSGMPTLRVGDLLRDHAIMEEARREAVAALDDERQAVDAGRLRGHGLGTPLRPGGGRVGACPRATDAHGLRGCTRNDDDSVAAGCGPSHRARRGGEGERGPDHKRRLVRVPLAVRATLAFVTPASGRRARAAAAVSASAACVPWAARERARVPMNVPDPRPCDRSVQLRAIRVIRVVRDTFQWQACESSAAH